TDLSGQAGQRRPRGRMMWRPVRGICSFIETPGRRKVKTPKREGHSALPRMKSGECKMEDGRTGATRRRGGISRVAPVILGKAAPEAAVPLLTWRVLFWRLDFLAFLVPRPIRPIRPALGRSLRMPTQR